MLLGIPRSARCVQRFDDSLKICNSHYLSHFAAFFIDARAKRSVVESCTIFFLLLQQTRRSDTCDGFIRDEGRGPGSPRGGAQGVGEREMKTETRRARRPRRDAATTSLERSLMILPQVHLRKPCYDF